MTLVILLFPLAFYPPHSSSNDLLALRFTHFFLAIDEWFYTQFFLFFAINEGFPAARRRSRIRVQLLYVSRFPRRCI